MMFILLFGCSTPQLQILPKIEPTITEQNIAEPLNYCQRGKYYRLLQYKHEMLFYLNSKDKATALQAAKNLQQVDEELNQLIIKAQKRRLIKRN